MGSDKDWCSRLLLSCIGMNWYGVVCSCSILLMVLVLVWWGV